MSPDDRLVRLLARRAVATALRRGELPRLPCEECGAPRSDAHHPSYEPEAWLDVRWLCRQHHLREHFRMRSVAAGRRLRWVDIRVEEGWRAVVERASRTR